MIQINVDTKDQAGAENAFLIPKQDTKGLYQWIEVYKADPNSRDPIGEAIGSKRIIQGVGFDGKRWHGAGAESLKEYAKSQKEFKDLMPISLQVGEGKSPQATVWSSGKNNEQVYLSFNKKSNIKPGDKVELIPLKEEDGIVVYKLMKGEFELGSYGFDRKAKQFRALEIYDRLNEPKDTTVADNFMEQIAFGGGEQM